jgi:small subunit ribosomal protein S1
MGQEMECRIIEMDRNRNNVVLSRRSVLEEEKKHEKSKILENITKGAVLSGKISSIVDFGAFVDLGGIDGLIHISELSWNHIDHPSEVVSIGDEVNVQVLEIEFDRERISLGLRQTQEDPWKERASKYSVGQVCGGRATKLVPFGVFVEIEEGLEGLIHISELAHRHVEMPQEIVKPNETVEAKIVGIDFDKRRVSLSIKQLTEAPKQEDSEEATVEAASPEAASDPVEASAATEETAAPAVETEAVESSTTEDVAEAASGAEETTESDKPVDPNSLEGVLKQMKAEHSKN